MDGVTSDDEEHSTSFECGSDCEPSEVECGYYLGRFDKLLEGIRRHPEKLIYKDVIDLNNEISTLKKCIESEGWNGKQFKNVMDDITDKQKLKSLSLIAVIDFLIYARWFGDFDGDASVIEKTWIKELFEKLEMTLVDEDAIDELATQPLVVLDNLFKNLEVIIELSAEQFIEALNETSLSLETRLKLLCKLPKALKSIKKANSRIRLEKFRLLLEKSGFDENVIKGFSEHFDQLEGLEWSVEQIVHILIMLVNGSRVKNFTIEDLTNCWQTAFDYFMTAGEFEEAVRECHASFNFKTLEKNVHSKAMLKFGQPHEKSLDELFAEIRGLNPWDDSRMSALQNELTGFKESMNSRSNLMGDPTAIGSFKKHDIELWVKEFKKQPETSNVAEKIALVVQAMTLFKKRSVREVQLLSLLVLFKRDVGRLAQINTGEGKTSIIAMLATLLCLEGKKVDIGE